MSALCVLLLGEYGNENRMFAWRDSNNDKLPCCIGYVCVCVFARAEILELCVAQSCIYD